MQIGVKLVSEAGMEPAALSDEHAASSGWRIVIHYGLPVLVMRGEALGPAELPAGARVEVDWRLDKPRRGPVWDFVERARLAGYPIALESDMRGSAAEQYQVVVYAEHCAQAGKRAPEEPEYVEEYEDWVVLDDDGDRRDDRVVIAGTPAELSEEVDRLRSIPNSAYSWRVAEVLAEELGLAGYGRSGDEE